MQDRSNSEMMIETLKLTIFGVIVVAFAYRVSLMQIFFLLSGMNMIIIQKRNGSRYAVFALMFSMLLNGALNDPFMAVSIAMLFHLPGIIMGLNMNENKKSMDIIFLGFVSSLVFLFIYIKSINFVFGISVSNEIHNAFLQAMNDSTFKSLNIQGLKANELKNILMHVIDLLPAISVVYSMLVAYFGYFFAASWLSKKEGMNYEGLEKFSFPGNVALGVSMIYVLTWLFQKIEPKDTTILAPNMLFVILFVLFLQGFASFAWFLEKIKIIKPFRVFILVVCIFLGPLSFMLSTFGFIDSIFDFRKLRN